MIENAEAAQRVFARVFSWSSTVEYRRAWAETTSHWVVFWNSASYYETGSPFDAIVGNGPLIVPKDGSEPFTFGSGEDWRASLEARGDTVLRVVDPGTPSWKPAEDAEWI